MTPDAERWQRIRACRDAGRPPEPADAAYLADTVLDLAEREPAVRVAVGLARHGGTRPASRQSERDRLVRDLYWSDYADMPPSTAAREMLAAAERRGASRKAPRSDAERRLDAAIGAGIQLIGPRRLADLVKYQEQLAISS